MPSSKNRRKYPRGDEEYLPTAAKRRAAAAAAAAKTRPRSQCSGSSKETPVPGTQGYGPPTPIPKAPRAASARKAPATPAPARSRKSVPAEKAASPEAEAGTSLPKLMLRFPVSLGKPGHPRMTTTTLKTGNDEFPEKPQDPREFDPGPQYSPIKPVEEPAAPAQVPHTLETLLEQASRPDAVRLHSLLIIVDGKKLIHYST